MSKRDGVAAAGLPGSRRSQVRDTKPYEIPTSLAALRGPAGGVVALSHSVLWAPGDGRVDLDTPGGTTLAYAAVISEGTVQEQVDTLNAERLVPVWDELLLPARARRLWESRFPGSLGRPNGAPEGPLRSPSSNGSM